MTEDQRDGGSPPARPAEAEVSIIIPVLNGETFIEETVRSALAQGPLVAEVIVVDDGSTDRTIAIIKAIADRRIRLHRRPAGAGHGVSAARNAGLAFASGQWVMFLDADDRLRPSAIAALHRAAGTNAGYVAAYGDYDRIDHRSRPIGRRYLMSSRAKPTGDLLPRLLRGNFIVNGGIMLVKTEAFREIGGFRESLRYCEDWHAWCRLSSLGWIRYVPGAPILDYRVHPASAMMRRALTLDDYRPALEAIFGDPTLVGALDPAERRSARAEAENHLRTYLACQALRSHSYGSAAVRLAEAIIRRPTRTPRIALLSIAAIAGL